jgi:hypothetical protein
MSCRENSQGERQLASFAMIVMVRTILAISKLVRFLETQMREQMKLQLGTSMRRLSTREILSLESSSEMEVEQLLRI